MGLGGEDTSILSNHDQTDNSIVDPKAAKQEFTWSEISQHTKKDSRWIVIDGCVYDVTRWVYKHPGGINVIAHYAGQDASEAFQAFHKDMKQTRKYLSPCKIGTVVPGSTPEVSQQDHEKRAEVRRDFEKLRQKAVEMGLFNASPTFFLLTFGHIVLLEILAYLNMLYFGVNWISYLVSVVLYTIVQSQASWLQHDFGHLSVFKSTKINHLCHELTMGFIKGVSCHWWNHLHYQHHSKPNVMDKDPDVRLQPLFVVGGTMPQQVAQKSSKFSLPYQLQHRYFFVVGPPLLFPLYFQFMTFRHAITRRRYEDLFWMMAFFVKLFFLYGPLLGVGGTLAYYFIVRMAESHWFTWVSQSNHIPMSIEPDREEPWLALQIHATCDVEQSAFNDWFTGHLNFQIEHHLFPTMPRHNYRLIHPHVKEICDRHGIPFLVKPIWTAFKDIVQSLKHSGEIWYAAYHAYHLD